VPLWLFGEAAPAPDQALLDLMPVATLVLWLVLLWALAPLGFPLFRRAFAFRAPASAPASGESAPVLSGLFDGGWAAARMCFLLSWTLLVFWLGHTGVPVRWAGAVLLVLAALSAWAWRRDWEVLNQELRGRARGIAWSDGVFLAVFALFFLLRCYWPDTGNGEKPMDIALVGASARADFLPPPNPYLAPSRLGGYYYFGHLETAVLTTTVGTTARWSYNLMCATLPALCVSLLWPLASALAGARARGALATLVVLGAGTLEPLRQWWEADSFSGDRAWPFGPKPLDYFSTSRVIPNPITETSGVNYTINEYPLFTFTYGDLHAHFFSMPVALLVSSAACALFFRSASAPISSTGSVWKTVALRGLFLGALLACLLMTNTWDAPVYWLLLALCAWPPRARPLAQATPNLSSSLNQSPPASSSQRRRARREAGVTPSASTPSHASAPALARWALVGVASLASVAVALPYVRNLHTNANTPTPLDLPATPLLAWLLFWGVFASAWALALALLSREQKRAEAEVEPGSKPLFSLGWVAVPVGAWALLRFAPAYEWTWKWPRPEPDGTPVVYRLGADYAVPILVATLALASWRVAWRSRDEAYALLGRMAFCAFAVLAWSELTWAGFLGPAPQGATYHRQDTVFKFGLQAWYLLGIAAACGALRAPSFRPGSAPTGSAPMWRRWGWPVSGAYACALVVMLMAAGACVAARARGFGFLETPDAWAHLALPEREAAAWLQERGRDGDTLLEAEQAAGGDYSEFSRFTHATGLASVVGPKSHTFQWGDGKRDAGQVWEEVERRRAAVRAFFTTRDPEERRRFLDEFGVRFIVLGQLERAEYGSAELGSEALDSLVATFPGARLFGTSEDERRVYVIDLKATTAPRS
jgi:YYY domain-containing protein